MIRDAWLLALALVACKPELSQEDWLITSTRVLAVKSEPAEAKPGTPLMFTALIANPQEASDASTVTWRFCTAPKAPTENNAVSEACLDDSSLTDAGTGASVVAAAPLDACLLFGPSTPPGGLRPRDPDDTGGYYQPLRVDVAGAVRTFHLERILCDLADASFDVASEFGKAYVPNENPHLVPIIATIGGQTVKLDRIPIASEVNLEVGWPAADAETYAYYDQATQAISSKRESMQVAWYVSAGGLNTESTGRAENDPSTSMTNTWTAPTTSGVARLWVVLRDSRGGIDFATYDLAVTP